MPAWSSHPFSATTVRPMRTTRLSSLLVVVLVQPRRIDRPGRGGGIDRIRSHWLFVNQVLDTQRGNFRAAAATGSESRQKQRPIAQVDRALAGADLQQLGQDIAGHRLFFRCRGRALARTASRSGQRVRIYQLVAAPHSFRGMRPIGAQEALRAQASFNLCRPSVEWILGPLSRVPEMVRDEL